VDTNIFAFTCTHGITNRTCINVLSDAHRSFIQQRQVRFIFQ